MRSDAELYLTFDVSRSMLARRHRAAPTRFDRLASVGLQVSTGSLDVPTGVATLTNRMMPLLFPTGDARGGERSDRSVAADHAAAARFRLHDGA